MTMRWLRFGLLVTSMLAGGLCAATEGQLTAPLVCEMDQAGYELEILENEPESEIRVRVSIHDFRIERLQVEGSTFTRLLIPQATSIQQEGEPQLPVISHHFRISDLHDVSVSIQPLSVREIRLNDPILPAQGLEVEDIEQIQHWNQEIYLESTSFPPHQAWTDRPGVLRDIRVLQVSFCPVRYDPQTNRLTLFEEAEIVISPLPGPGTNPKVHWGPIHRSWARLYRSVVANPDPDWYDLTNRGRERYLLVVPDEFEAALQGFICWKEEQGYYVDVLRMSEVGSLNWQDLHAELLALYVSHQRPDWVCLFGNTNNTPHTSSTGFSYTDDLCFSLMEGDDYLPDFYFSRLPAQDVDQLCNMVNRTLYWEREPQTWNPDMYKTAFMASAANYTSQTTVKQQVGERLQRVHDYETIHTMYSWGGGSTSTLIGWINDGVSIINYRGEGWRTGWNPSGGSFHVEDVQTIQNPFMTPIFTSIGCGVNGFASAEPCFGEAWMRLGTPETPMGCVAILGPTGNTHTTYNNWMDRGIYRGLAYDGITQTAAAYLAGKMYMKNHFPEPSHAYTLEQSFREFINLGTPDTQYRTCVPYPPYLGLGYGPDSMEPVVCVRSRDGDKLEDCFLSLETGGTRLVMDYDDHAGGFLLPEGLTDFTLTLSGYNIPAVRTELAQETRYAQVLITEVKPDIPSDGTVGDIVELYNPGLISVNLKNYVLTDLDYFDGPIVTKDAFLLPHQIAVIHFLGAKAIETVTSTGYGLLIQSQAMPGLSSDEDQAILRAPDGSVVDGLAWHNATGVTTLNQASDISRLTGPGTPFEVRTHGWWEGPNWIHEDDYEDYTIDWSAYAGSEGPGSIQRISAASPDSPANFLVQASTNFGTYVESSNAPVDPEVHRAVLSSAGF